MTIISRRLVTALIVVALVWLVAPPIAFAQAWVPAKGEGSVAIAVQDMFVRKHLATTTAVDVGHIESLVLQTDVTYGLTNKFAVDFAVPLVTSRYNGAFPHAGTNVDDGNFRGTFTDIRVAVRYNVTRRGAVFTPYVGSVTPSHDYTYYGHAAAGQRLQEVQVGTYAAKLFTSGLPGVFVSGRLAYGFVEKVLDISHNRSSGDLEVGYFVTPGFRAFVTSSAQLTHGGVDFPQNGPPGLPLKYQPVHDVVQRVNSLDVGGGFAYSLSDSFDLFASYSRLAAGRNGHALERGITLGGSWSFSRRQAATQVTAAGSTSAVYEGLTAKRQGSLGRCICQKSGM